MPKLGRNSVTAFGDVIASSPVRSSATKSFVSVAMGNVEMAGCELEPWYARRTWPWHRPRISMGLRTPTALITFSSTPAQPTVVPSN
jgi:hypothetical protein